MINNRIFLSVFLRSFLLQALWNFERLQNVGFAYGILPVLRKIYPSAEERKEAVLRHMSFFNTHPYMVNMIFGLVSAMEEDASKGKIHKDEITKTKNNIAGPLAAIGDSFFWATWLPFVVILTVSLIIFFWDKSSPRGTFVPLIFFLTMYNLIALPFCYWSLLMSFKLQNKVIKLIVGIDFQKSMNLIRLLSKAILTVLLIFYIAKFSGGVGETALFIIVFLSGAVLGCLRWSPIAIFYLTLLISLAAVLTGIA
ncbi:MAG: PTS system mannose/fructose/sorbose family transporter subunit IID [Elusimicrobiota bacterium]